jgi:hypothetical protein
MRLLVAVLIFSAVLVLGIAALETRALSPQPSSGPAHGVVWNGKTFASRADFARWLRSHGTSYRVWARRHPAEAGLKSGGQKHSGWGPGRLAGVAALLAALALGLVLVRRRWPGSGAAAASLIEDVALRGAAAAVAGARATRRSAIPTARRTAALATAAASRARHGLGRSTAYLIEVVAPRGAAAAAAGARTTRRSATLTARRTAALAATYRARHGLGRSGAHRLEIVALRGASAAKARARTTRRLAALTAQRSTVLPTAPSFRVRGRRYDLVWYVTMALLAVGIGVLMAAWLNGG